MQKEERLRNEEKKKREYGELNLFKSNINHKDNTETAELHLTVKHKDNLLKKISDFIKSMLMQ